MRALAWTCDGVALVERPAPAPAAGEVAIAVAYAGVCRTDLAVVDGDLAVAPGRVLGHELSGRLVDTGEPVTVIPFAPCGTCGLPRCGSPRWLGVAVDGAYADRVCVPATSVIRLPASVSLLHGAYVEPVAAALGALAWIRPGDRVLVDGVNRIAELTARVIAAHGAAVARTAEDGAFEVVVETAGGELAALLARLRPGGTLILKSRAERVATVPVGLLVARDLVVRGASHGSFAVAVAWLAEQRIVVDDLLGVPQPLEAYADVFAAARSSEHTKPMFAVGGG